MSYFPPKIHLIHDASFISRHNASTVYLLEAEKGEVTFNMMQVINNISPISDGIKLYAVRSTTSTLNATVAFINLIHWSLSANIRNRMPYRKKSHSFDEMRGHPSYAVAPPSSTAPRASTERYPPRLHQDASGRIKAAPRWTLLKRGTNLTRRDFIEALPLLFCDPVIPVNPASSQGKPLGREILFLLPSRITHVAMVTWWGHSLNSGWTLV